MLGKVFREALDNRETNTRAVGKELGISHTMPHRVINNQPVDLNTILAVPNEVVSGKG